MKKLVREHLYEKFEEESDPIEDMGIGREYVKNKIREYIRENEMVAEGWSDESIDKRFVFDAGFIFNSDLSKVKGLDEELDKLIIDFEKEFNKVVLPLRKALKKAEEGVDIASELFDKYFGTHLKLPKNAPSIYAGDYLGSNKDLRNAEKIAKIASEKFDKGTDKAWKLADNIAVILNRIKNYVNIKEHLIPVKLITHLFEKFEEESDPIKDMGIGFDPAKDSAKYVDFVKNYKPTWVKTKGPGNRKNTQDTYDAGPGPILTIKDIVNQLKKEAEEGRDSYLKLELSQYLKRLGGKNKNNLYGVYVYNRPLALIDAEAGHTPMDNLRVDLDPRTCESIHSPSRPVERHYIVNMYQQIFLTKRDIEYILNKINNL